MGASFTKKAATVKIDVTANKTETKQLDPFMVLEMEDVFDFNNKFSSNA